MFRFFSALVGLGLLAVMPLKAATLIPVVPVPDSVETDAFTINDNNMIGGGYFTADEVEHGFFGTLDGTYTTLDFGSGSTQVRGIDNNGDVVGTSFATGGHCTFSQFYRAVDGTPVAIVKGHNAIAGIDGNFNSKGQFVGDYCTKRGVITGYLGKAGIYRSDIVIDANNASTSPRGITTKGKIAGFFIDNETGGDTAFVLSEGVTTIFNYPDPTEVDTLLQAINDKGLAVGHWDAGDFQWHAFILDTNTNEITPIKVHGASFVQAFGINKAGLVPLLTDVGSFVYCPHQASRCPTGGAEVPEETFHFDPAMQHRHLPAAVQTEITRRVGRPDGDGMR